MSVKLEPGTYQCKTTGATIYEAPSGAVMCRIGLDIGLTGGICLIQKDGTLSERGFRDAAAILGIQGGWDWDAWGADPEAWAGHDVEAVVETVQGDRGEFSSVKYLNQPGGGGNALPKADAKALAAKWGAKTRALFGGAPAAPKAPSKPAPRPPAAKPPPPKPPVKVGTMDEAWAEFCRLNESMGEAALYVAWDALIERVVGKHSADATPDDWGRVMVELGQSLPM